MFNNLITNISSGIIQQATLLNQQAQPQQPLYVADFVEVGLSDSDVIDAALAALDSRNNKTIIFDTKQWNVDRAILLSSGTNVVVDGVKIKQNNEVFDNVFRGNNLTINQSDPYGYPTSISALSDITITGINGAQIEGPDINKTGIHPNLGSQFMVGDFWGWRTFQICFSLATNIEISGFAFTKQRCWAISFDKCSYLDVHDLTFDSTVKNGDGVDFRSGCHHINCYNISGTTSDDLVAFTAINMFENRTFPYLNYVHPLEPSMYMDEETPVSELAIHDVVIYNVSGDSGDTPMIILLSTGGREIYNVEITNIIQTNAEHSDSVIRIFGSTYGTGYQDDDIHDILIDGVTSLACDYAVRITHKVNNVTLKNLINNAGVGYPVYYLQYPAGVTVISNFVSVYNFDEETGTTANDASGNARNGNNVNITINQTGKLGKAYQFNGSSSYVDIPDDLRTFTQGAISFWIKPTSLANDADVFSFGTGASNLNFFKIGILSQSNGIAQRCVQLLVRTSGNAISYSGSIPLVENQWNHVVVSMSSSEGNRIYVNGVRDIGAYSVGSAASVYWFDDMPVGSEAYIGRFKYGGAYYSRVNGLIDQFVIKDGAISSTEVSNIYNSGVGLNWELW